MTLPEQVDSEASLSKLLECMKVIGAINFMMMKTLHKIVHKTMISKRCTHKIK